MKTIPLKSSDLAKLRRIALSRQGLTTQTPFGRGRSGTEAAIKHLGYVQIDTISVVERAHHHVLHSRVPNYNSAHLDQLLEKGQIFEYWAHAAAYLPVDAYRFTLPYKKSIKSGKRHWYKNPDQKLMAKLMRQVRDHGPLQSKDIEGGKRKAAGWWDWKPGKRALEQLYFQGDLMVASRHGFQKAYDLPERVLPQDIDTSLPSFEEYANYLLEQQLQCHGFVSLKGITYQRRDSQLRTATKQEVEKRLAEKSLVTLETRSGDTYFATPDCMDRKAPPAPAKLKILSPFDNSLIQRDRLLSLFQFDYQIECYVPEAKRKYGYFCLPLLFQDRFVGRMDCKIHRKQSRLEVKALHFEDAAKDVTTLVRAFGEAIVKFAAFQGAEEIEVSAVFPNNLYKAVRSSVEEGRP